MNNDSGKDCKLALNGTKNNILYKLQIDKENVKVDQHIWQQ